jgi:hypothetical protein
MQLLFYSKVKHVISLKKKGGGEERKKNSSVSHTTKILKTLDNHFNLYEAFGISTSNMTAPLIPD